MSSNAEMLLARIEKFLQSRGLAASRFGRQAAGDPRLVFDLRRGRVVGTSLATKLQRAMTEGSTWDGHAKIGEYEK